MQTGRTRATMEERSKTTDPWWDGTREGTDGRFNWWNGSWHEYFRKGKSRQSDKYRPAKPRWKK